ncbi:DoxX family protein [Confluentibacter flavum]|uniref:DoxX family protein n=1 Tax=Confluentibacter flavum TaxID=1909700 RepID=A0A2N3HKL1_9FLAO|nr:DoxX family protein [Confluentibacter flavum]PKQ45519.1 hypothetical protein CSW08_07665 [Confluentibacter flavum]
MTTNNNIPKLRLWISYILQGIIVIMLLMGAFNNLLMTEMAVTGAKEMGYPEYSVHYLGIILLVSTLLYAIPKTAFIGAILLTGWLGGAVATHIIHGDPLYNMFFPIVFGIVVWTCLLLRHKKMCEVLLNR